MRILALLNERLGVLPNLLNCPFCKLNLNGYQELKEAQLGAIYTIEKEEDPIEFFGIDPEEYVNVDELVQNYMAEQYTGYENE